MSKKAAKKATKPEPQTKGKGASKDAANKPSKDNSQRKPESADVANAAPAKGAKRRVTVSLKGADAADSAPKTGETRHGRETRHGETIDEARDTGGSAASKLDTPKRSRRIIAVPSSATANDAVVSEGFANSPFAAGADEPVDELATESSVGAKKRGKAPTANAESSKKVKRGAAPKPTAASKGKLAEDKGTKQTASASKANPAKGSATPAKKKAPKAGNQELGLKGGKSIEAEAKRASAGETLPASPPEPRAAREKKGKKAPKPEPSAQAQLPIEAPSRSDANSEAASDEKPSPGKSRSRARESKADVAHETPSSPASAEPDGEDHLSLVAEAVDGEEDDDDDESVLQISADAGEDDEEEELSEEEENRRYLKGIIEALLFASDKPLTGRELARAARIDKKRTLQLLTELRKEYKRRGVNIVEVSGGFVLRSNPAYGAFVQKALALRPVKLSRAQLETLAIIAYRQPITRPEIDDIRGVDSGQVLKGLADRDLIKMLGKKDEAGRPMLYGTTQTFLELFSLDSLKGLPNLREFTELSEDSREKFTAVTGETIAGPTVMANDASDPDDGTLGEALASALPADFVAAELESLEPDATDERQSDAGFREELSLLDDDAPPEHDADGIAPADEDQPYESVRFPEQEDAEQEDAEQEDEASEAVDDADEEEPVSDRETSEGSWEEPPDSDFSDDEPR